MPEPTSTLPSGSFVFQDPQGKRWPRLRRVLLGWGVLVALSVVWFFQTLLVRPELKLPASIRTLKGQLTAATQRSALPTSDPNEMNWTKFYEQSPRSQERLARVRAQLRKAGKPKGEIRLGLYVDWDPNSFASLEEHAGSLTHLAPEWFTLLDTDSKLQIETDRRLATFAAARGLTMMPILRNLAENEWQPEAVENLARGPADKRARFINELLGALQRAHAGGLIIDWQQLDPSYRDDYTELVAQIAETLHAADLEVWFMASLGEDFQTFDLEAIGVVTDRFVAVLHDENSESDAPGPIASQSWLGGWLKVIAEKDRNGSWRYGDPAQWIGLLGAYAYDWNTTTKKTETISFKDAMSRASYAGVDRDGKVVKVEAPSYNGEYDYSEPGGGHTVSFLDAISFYNQALAVRIAGLGGLGVSRLGTEDPQIWDVLELRTTPGPVARKALGQLRASETITHVGRGEIVRVDVTRDDGARTVETDPDGLLRATYSDFPTYPILYHEGAGEPHQVAITFDDGPDPKWTPMVLAILRARGVKAAFFLVGRNCENNPGLVLQILREGHEIGNHTFSHGNLAAMSPEMMRLELNATQRLIESITGRSTTLFRPPYNADSNPTDIAELAPLKLAQEELGYTVVLEKVDPQDWARPGADVIVRRVKELRSEGNIVLLHDAGGNRAQTVEALPQIIDYLQIRGDRIVPLSELLQIPRDELMPPVTGSQPLERMVAGTGFRLWHATVEFFWAFMIFATGLVMLRTLLVAWLAQRHHGKTAAFAIRDAPVFAPPLTVIIAAYNEAKVIAKTLRSVLETDYVGEFEVLVVDDGSRDATAEEVAHAAAADGRLCLIRQPNAGKSAALARGLAQARHAMVVFLDADTLFERTTLGAIVQPLANPLVGAVSGNARVGNLRSFLARCQSLEYICGFNLDRRAYTEWNCITVVPGAVSALRKSAIEAAGGFSQETLAEDTDLTLILHRLGYHIAYAPEAIAWTEAPETFSTLARQRFRWAFGTMQCLWKHRDLVFNPRFGALGWFSLPGIWFFQILLVAITPLVDAVLIWSLLFGHAAAIWYYFAAFLVMDIFLALLACRIEGERAVRALIIVPMRFLYRPLLSWVIWKSIIHALKGALVGWGKLERTGAVPSRA
ncbi:MAG: peptidoglycan-N-acetylglucosamine deacetylase [Chthoniobacter sp.]|jgi:cellulose synthase/poly-beta-1,6-N-acetylglucosamine synthase-like glycosyltransferase/peptidoglycan/xylan/chitin deacetylase (PgdA/CDA1 family)/spore germination protein YaaH|nr:peptidoglycan-N-acetylglucosamine deacetylase [Chthoniobacter sp.]